METSDYRRTVLSVDHIKLFTEGEDRGEYVHAHFDLLSGQLALVRMNNLQQTASFADAFSGLLKPSLGSIRFFGRDWRESAADITNAMRGKIGRVFSTGNWLDGFTLSENILLPQLHHTRRPKNKLRQEAALLANQFGLPGLPIGLPAEYTRADRRRTACVRAFIGEPSLLLLEDPTFGIYPDVMGPLITAVRRAGSSGAAVFWMTLSDDVWQDGSIPADRRFRISGRELIELERKT